MRNLLLILNLGQEMYEPIWEETVFRLNAQGIRVRSIWIADGASQSASGVLNEDILGNDRESSHSVLFGA